MKTFLAVLVLVSASLIAPSGAFAQGGPGRTYSRYYNPKTIETVSGTVLGIERVAGRGRFAGIHLMLKTRTGELSVHLGPSWYIDKQALKIVPHDTIEVTGSRITYHGKVVLVAAEVRRGNETLMLRDTQGYPLWSRSRRR